jgi:hypothetical protein
MMVSPGLQKAISTAWLACEPEFGWTLAASAPNNALQAIDGELLGDVNVFATTVVALARVTFGVLVGELGALGFHDGLAHVVFGRDQFDVVFLTLDFSLHGLPEFRVNFCQGVFRGKHGECLKPLKRVEILSRGEFIKDAGFQMRCFTPGFYVPFAVDRSNPVQPRIGNQEITRRFKAVASGKAVDDIEDTAMQNHHHILPGMRRSDFLESACHTFKHGVQTFAIFKTVIGIAPLKGGVAFRIFRLRLIVSQALESAVTPLAHFRHQHRNKAKREARALQPLCALF